MYCVEVGNMGINKGEYEDVLNSLGNTNKGLLLWKLNTDSRALKIFGKILEDKNLPQTMGVTDNKKIEEIKEKVKQAPVCAMELNGIISDPTKCKLKRVDRSLRKLLNNYAAKNKMKIMV